MLKEHIHKFRNALVKATELESYRLYSLGRWNELNSFPFGSCDLASNFLAQYLKEKGIEVKIIWCINTLDEYEMVKNHVWLEVNNKFIDITISQFPEFHHERIYICDKNNPSMLRAIYDNCKILGIQNYCEREITLSSGNTCGYALYEEIKIMADAAV